MKRYDSAEMNERLNISVNRINGGYYIWAKRHGLQENRLTVLYALGDGKTHTQTEIMADSQNYREHGCKKTYFRGTAQAGRQ